MYYYSASLPNKPNKHLDIYTHLLTWLKYRKKIQQNYIQTATFTTELYTYINITFSLSELGFFGARACTNSTRQC